MEQAWGVAGRQHKRNEIEDNERPVQELTWSAWGPGATVYDNAPPVVSVAGGMRTRRVFGGVVSGIVNGTKLLGKYTRPVEAWANNNNSIPHAYM